MSVNIEEIYQKTIEHYRIAQENLLEHAKKTREYSATAISDVVPDFKADKLEFGSYDKGNFAVLFVDMRDSTKRAETVGPERTFLTMHVFLTALLETIKYYDGKVIDIMGDGIMVFWGGKAARQEDGMNKSKAIQNAGLCGLDMLKVREKVINKIIKDEILGNTIHIGIGVTFDSVVVTKIGIENSYDVKAFGNCINLASKYAGQIRNQVKVSKKVKNEWPSGEGGKISFSSNQDGYCITKTD